jgi:hypothetical protein
MSRAKTIGVAVAVALAGAGVLVAHARKGKLSADEALKLAASGLTAQRPGERGPHDAGSPTFDLALELQATRAREVLGAKRWTYLNGLGWNFWGKPEKSAKQAAVAQATTI